MARLDLANSERVHWLTRYNSQTRPFNDKNLWSKDGSQPFIWSTGDR